jgi:TctA family transporter
MLDQRTRNAISASAISLVLSIVCIGLVIYFASQSSPSVFMITLVSLTCCVSMIMHFIFVGLTAQRLGRNAAVWVVLALLLFPLSSIIGLILFEWFSDEKNQLQPSADHQ